MPALRLPVTVVIPVKNEERNLARCLDRLKRFDKIVVVDSGSTDRTRKISQEHGCEFVSFRWDGHFPKKRNWFLINHPPKTPWVFFLDADEYLTDEFVDELARALAMTTHVGFRVMYSNYFLGKKLKYGVPQIKLPIFRVGSGLYERIEEDEWSVLDMEVHEHPVLEGTVGQLNTLVDHQDFKGLDAYIARHNEYASWEARRYLKLRETPEATAHFTAIQRRKYDSLTSWWLAPSYFLYSWIWKRGILDGWAGFVFAKMKASYFSQIRRKIREFGAGKS
ncbi:MAG: glycosyltransferase family 2 protein [Planctomycetota bacterium]|nr:glycosyltransferase family 2 protein [Planctomycetota bacterium]